MKKIGQSVGNKLCKVYI